MRFVVLRQAVQCLVVLIGLASVTPLSAATFIVTNTADAGPGSLRTAISNANAVAGSDLINFAIPGTGPFTINLSTVLPSVLEPVTIDGTSQPGYLDRPLVDLDGNSALGNGSGIYVLTSNTVVKGLSVSRFPRDGIRIENFGGNTVKSCFIGTGPFGTNFLGNGTGGSGLAGISIASGGNVIGGTNAADRNVISGGNLHGIYIYSGFAISNRIVGNLIGTDASGLKRAGNANHGILFAGGARGNTVGGLGGGERNTISGNGQSGVYLLDNATTFNVIQGNYVGTDVSGIFTVSNSTDGITIYGAVSNLIGGAVLGARNVISGNGGRGVIVSGSGAHDNLVQGNYLGTDVSGAFRVPNQAAGVELLNVNNNTVGGVGSLARNVISGNGLSGVAITDTTATGNTVLGNFIGTDATGSNALSNGRSGVFLAGVSSNTVGGNIAGAGNVISGNVESGVRIADATAQGNVVQGNLVGTDLNGTRRVANGNAGVVLESASNFIGGAAPAARNIISGNGGSGVFLYLSKASNNVIQGNFIGTSITGSAALSNSFGGIGLTNASGNWIGGTNAGEGNVISGNRLNGIYLQGQANGNVIRGNYIGTDVTGFNALGNGAGLAVADFAGGVDISASAGNLIGGSAPGAGNLIAANLRDAITVGDPGASNNVIKGNLVGVKADGLTALGNEWNGIEIRSAGGGANTVIGGPEPGAGNVLAYATLSQRSGVRVRTASGNTGILIQGNSIFFNGGGGATGLGIAIGDKANVTPIPPLANDNCDSDTGANLLQNYPVLTNVQSAGNVTLVRGTMNSAPNTTFQLQFFANPTAEPSGNIEGRFWMGDATVTTDGTCNGAFTAILTNGVPAGQRLTATATDPANNTSEFSAAYVVVAAQLPTLGIQPQSQAVPYGSNATFMVSATGTGPLAYQWRFNGTNLNGATGTSLGPTNLRLKDAGNYSVAVSNTFGITVSSNALLTVLVTQPALLASSTGNGGLTLSWPTNEPVFRLLQATNLVPPVLWTDVTNQPIVTNGQYRVSPVSFGVQRFFRLTTP